MQQKKPPCYVRTERRRWALTQGELAHLLGFEHRSSVSRIERGQVIPEFETALALQVIFGVAPSDLFPKIFDEIEERVMRQGAVLYEATLQSSKVRERRKRELLELAMQRATEPKRV